jgi:hypothetical protein
MAPAGVLWGQVRTEHTLRSSERLLNFFGRGGVHVRGVRLVRRTQWPAVFLNTLRTGRGWPVSLLSSAITCHFLLSAIIITRFRRCVSGSGFRL